jgi:hypothetical protein
VRPEHAPDFDVGKNTSYLETIQAVFLGFFFTDSRLNDLSTRLRGLVALGSQPLRIDFASPERRQ